VKLQDKTKRIFEEKGRCYQEEKKEMMVEVV
jgi:hypothetical protein